MKIYKQSIAGNDLSFKENCVLINENSLFVLTISLFWFANIASLIAPESFDSHINSIFANDFFWIIFTVPWILKSPFSYDFKFL